MRQPLLPPTIVSDIAGCKPPSCKERAGGRRASPAVSEPCAGARVTVPRTTSVWGIPWPGRSPFQRPRSQGLVLTSEEVGRIEGRRAAPSAYLTATDLVVIAARSLCAREELVTASRVLTVMWRLRRATFSVPDTAPPRWIVTAAAVAGTGTVGRGNAALSQDKRREKRAQRRPA